jgi:sigma-54-specific transcriptional regulator
VPVLTLPQADKLTLSVRAKALVFEDPRSRALLSRIEQVAPSDATVLIAGETGTGKEIVARHIHELSYRAGKPFVAVNCGAFSESLIESDLFGHEKGAFTGALNAKGGWFEAANGGTLFLDEIGDLPLGAQVKLLRVLQEREVVRLGARQSIPIDVRLIAATNVKLEEAVAAGHFREDLFFRLAVANVSVAALRERPGDVLPLAQYFLQVYWSRLRKERRGEVPELTPEAQNALLAHPWMGNIRELENAIHHALLVCKGGRITPDDLPLIKLPHRRTPTGPLPMLGPELAPSPPVPPEPVDARAAFQKLARTLCEEGGPHLWDDIEEMVIRAAYEHARQNQLRMARLLGVSRNVVRARLLQFGILPRAGSRDGEPDDGASTTEEVTPLRSASDSNAGPTVVPLPAAPSRIKVRIGRLRLGPLTLMKINGALERKWRDRQIDLEWSQFTSGPQIVEAMREGRLDLGVVGEMSSIVGQATDVPLVYLAAEPPFPEGEAIVVHHDSPIRAVADLKGKTIALNRGANTDYLLLRALDEAQLDYDDVNLSYVATAGARAAFEHREVDAWVLWNPDLATVKQTRSARVLRDGTGLVGNLLCYVGTRTFADARPDLGSEFLAEVRRSGLWINQNQSAAIDLFAEHTGIERPAIAAALTARRFGAQPLDDSSIEGQQGVADRLLRARRIKRHVAVADAQWLAPLTLVDASASSEHPALKVSRAPEVLLQEQRRRATAARDAGPGLAMPFSDGTMCAALKS